MQWFSNFFGSRRTVKHIHIFWHTLCTKLKTYWYFWAVNKNLCTNGFFFSFLKYTFMHLATSCGTPFENHCCSDWVPLLYLFWPARKRKSLLLFPPPSLVIRQALKDFEQFRFVFVIEVIRHYFCWTLTRDCFVKHTRSNFHLAELEDSAPQTPMPTTGCDPGPLLSTFHLKMPKMCLKISCPLRFS
jgi:hypothetical protein